MGFFCVSKCEHEVIGLHWQEVTQKHSVHRAFVRQFGSSHIADYQFLFIYIFL